LDLAQLLGIRANLLGEGDPGFFVLRLPDAITLLQTAESLLRHALLRRWRSGAQPFRQDRKNFGACCDGPKSRPSARKLMSPDSLSK
jgi:hypothetical protein